MTSSALQPAEFAAGIRIGVIVGGVASRLIVIVRSGDVPPSLVAEQENVTPAMLVSLVTSASAQPLEEIADSGSVSCHDTWTSPVYHPLSPSVPVTTGVTVGGVESPKTVTVALRCAAFPMPSVAVQVTVTVFPAPTPPIPAPGVKLLTRVTVGRSGSSSTAATEASHALTAAVVVGPLCKVMFCGGVVNVGAVLSTTSTWAFADEVNKPLSTVTVALNAP